MVNDFGKPPVVVGLHEPLFFDKYFIERVVSSLKKKAFMVKVEVDEFSPAEQFAYLVLKDNGWFPKEE